MSIKQFPKDQFHKIFNNDEIIKCGSLIPDIDCELKILRNYFLINNKSFMGGNERFRSIIYSDSGYTSPIYTSSWSKFSDISNLVGPSWIGWVTSLFNRDQLKAGNEYYLAIEIDQYSRDMINNFYISIKYDFDNSVFPKVSTQFADYPIAFEPYVYLEYDE